MVGTWMQTVGAQWLLIDEPNAATLVSLVQTASLLPMLLLALPAGVLADSFDRRRLLIGVQLGTVVVGTALTVATFLGDISPQVLLALTFLLGCGQAMSMPPWQALIPDIVPTEQVRAAAALGAVAMNVARAVGPALAGLLITQVDVAVVFALNTSSYAVLAFVLFRWGPSGRVSGDMPERFVPALRAGRPLRAAFTSGPAHAPALRTLRPARLGVVGVAPARRRPASSGWGRVATVSCWPRWASARSPARSCSHGSWPGSRSA